MLPKPTYDREYASWLTERKSVDKMSAKSSMFPEIHKSPILKIGNKKITKIVKNVELKSTSSIDSLKNQNSDKKNSRVVDSILVPLNDRSLITDNSSPKVIVDKLESIKRIANKIEESK